MSLDLKRIQKSELSSVLRDFYGVNTHSERGEMERKSGAQHCQMQMARKRPREIDGEVAYHWM